MPRLELATLQAWEYQTPAVLDQAAPTQNLYYQLLSTSQPTRLYKYGQNIEDADETLDWRLTVDGIQYATAGLACTHSTNYFGYIHPSPIGGLVQARLTNSINQLATFIAECHSSMLIEARKTTALGAGKLEAVATYALKKLL